MFVRRPPGANLTQATFTDAHIHKADLTTTRPQKAVVTTCGLPGSTLHGAAPKTPAYEAAT
ncbi:pentapeptide repeat-containing protein [Embleya scabrispora]|uniref:pentapeptide repeat-containing protein n=1 Tax=Embleya scabrispora TaxID=159449 RepID=UPI0013752BFF